MVRDSEEGEATEGRDGGPSRFITRHDWDDSQDISTTVINAVAAIVGRAPTDIQPLYEAIDPDALDALLRSLRSTTNGHNQGRVFFSFNSCEVTVIADGTIRIETST